MIARTIRGIILLSIYRKVYGRIIIQKVKKGAEELIGEELSSF